MSIDGPIHNLITLEVLSLMLLFIYLGQDLYLGFVFRIQILCGEKLEMVFCFLREMKTKQKLFSSTAKL